MQNHEIKDAVKQLRVAFNDMKDKFDIVIELLSDKLEQETETIDTATNVRIDN